MVAVPNRSVAVLHRTAEPTVPLRQIQGEIELRRCPGPVHRPQPQILDLQMSGGNVLQNEYHLEEGVCARLLSGASS